MKPGQTWGDRIRNLTAPRVALARHLIGQGWACKGLPPFRLRCARLFSIMNRACHAFTRSLKALPAVNLTVIAAAICIASPVAGLRPVRAARAPNEPKPINCTVSPFANAEPTISVKASMTCAVADLLSPVTAETIDEFLLVHSKFLSD